MAVKISSVRHHSPASRHFVKAGDKLISVNGHEVRDVLDYQFYIDDAPVLVIEKPNGKQRTVHWKQGLNLRPTLWTSSVLVPIIAFFVS